MKRPFLWNKVPIAPAITALAILSCLTTPAQAGMPVNKAMTCPVGGEQFTYVTTSSYSTFGARPDGKPYGSWVFPLQLPVCPKNGMTLYKHDFTPEEVARLTPLVTSDAYQALLQDTPYYRAAWLMEKMGYKDAATWAWSINQASWEADDNPALKARYQREFAERVAALPDNPDSKTWVAMQARAANAWRELGEFDRARASLAAISRDKLDLPEPQKNDRSETAKEARERRSWLAFIDKLNIVIARGDRSSEPLDLLDAHTAAGLCLNNEEKGKPADPLCASPAIKQEAESMRERRKEYREKEKGRYNP